jgi:hypothetical protein
MVVGAPGEPGSPVIIAFDASAAKAAVIVMLADKQIIPPARSAVVTARRLVLLEIFLPIEISLSAGSMNFTTFIFRGYYEMGGFAGYWTKVQCPAKSGCG